MDVNQICPYCMKQISDEQICPYCKKKTKEIPKGGHCLRPFTILRGKYLVGGVLGEGGVEITYKGMEIERQMPVIIKEFFRERLMTRDVMVSTAVMMNPDADKEVVERGKTNYLKETMFLSGLSDFSSLVGIKEFFWENDTIYRVQEYLEGETLKSFMKSKGGRIPVEELLRYMEPVIRDLHKVHIKGYIHGSISPNEFMLLENGTMKVFGIDTAIDLWQKREKSESVFFQHGYAPEEQYRTGGKLGPWTDVYALCATMYKCITGVTPLEALERLRIDEMKWPSDMGIPIDADFENVLKKGMAVHAENRFQDMQQLYDAIYSHNLIKEWQPKTGTIKMVKCAIGHYYDAMVHAECPYCADMPEVSRRYAEVHYEKEIHAESSCCDDTLEPARFRTDFPSKKDELVYYILKGKYIKMFNREITSNPNNYLDLFPLGWDTFIDYESKIRILVEAITNNQKISETELYQNLE